MSYYCTCVNLCALCERDIFTFSIGIFGICMYVRILTVHIVLFAYCVCRYVLFSLIWCDYCCGNVWIIIAAIR